MHVINAISHFLNCIRENCTKIPYISNFVRMLAKIVINDSKHPPTLNNMLLYTQVMDIILILCTLKTNSKTFKFAHFRGEGVHM